MYRAHSKDINRNKSFHPLTFGNLRRVEQLKEAFELNKEKAAERQKELQRDQEERRYDELLLATSADSRNGELARYRQTRNIFAAEYEADAKAATGAPAKSPQQSSETSKQETPIQLPSGASSPLNNFLSKFKKEEAHGATRGLVKTETQEDTTTTTATPNEADPPMRKRPRDDTNGHTTTTTTDCSNGGASAPATGFVTSAEAAQLRKELSLAQKQRHDPLMRVKQYQNRCVAAAATRQQRQEEETSAKAARGDDKEMLQSRIRKLLALKKKVEE
ncbi:hypothetical protein JKF63_05813 [Porcisia hertigi]|uniref:CBF1-interacting co-repressor CIR N-terminal domain-containing protein n=1 Tax=Porcisia hertigi TaxID=2761500 RepID=A0A836LE29_9TRYP|nr:hypothetical protein JKF63_05813 [Porcisia hertigi]